MTELTTGTRTDGRGLFAVLEGIDGSGTTTQKPLLHNYASGMSKEIDVLTTHEPWKSGEIRRMLQEDRNAFIGGEKMARLYIEDRRRHLWEEIIPALNAGNIVISDRYSLSTFAYQGTQGIDLNDLREMHNQEGIINPDITFYLDVDLGTAIRRVRQRHSPLEKFEKDSEFTEALIAEYRHLTKIGQEDPSLFGKIIKIDGNKTQEEVSRVINAQFRRFYNQWNQNQ